MNFNIRLEQMTDIEDISSYLPFLHFHNSKDIFIYNELVKLVHKVECKINGPYNI